MSVTPGGSSEAAESLPLRLVVGVFFARRCSGMVFGFFRTIMKKAGRFFQQLCRNSYEEQELVRPDANVAQAGILRRSLSMEALNGDPVDRSE
ncbi:hypothetical protein TNCV_4392431 [Trichonephila clavipes]|nr:hypothetical protein TNCV_4392431 [Trichonephila clavipes]